MLVHYFSFLLRLQDAQSVKDFGLRVPIISSKNGFTGELRGDADVELLSIDHILNLSPAGFKLKR